MRERPHNAYQSVHGLPSRSARDGQREMDMTRDGLAALGAMDDTTTTGVALPTGVVTFLLSDVEGSTRLWEGDESEMGAAIARHYELLDAAILLHGGVRPVEQGEGDSVVGAFTSPSDAVAAALDAQRTRRGL